MHTRTARRCPGCLTRHYLPSLSDPRWCYRCALWLTPWRAAPFGKVRKLPPRLRATW